MLVKAPRWLPPRPPVPAVLRLVQTLVLGRRRASGLSDPVQVGAPGDEGLRDVDRQHGRHRARQ